MRDRAGFHVGEGRNVDYFRLTAWLITEKNKPTENKSVQDYEEKKEKAADRAAAVVKAGRDIGQCPPVVDPKRKANAELDFRFFCDTYLPMTFNLPWSADHLKIIGKIETAVLEGGLSAMATPRGFGKSCLAETACLWAVLHGHRNFVCLIGSDEGHARSMLDSIKMELDGNDLLLEDYPESCYPIRCLEGIANRCNGQLSEEKRTHISWTTTEIVLPMIEESPAAGGIIKVAGLTGRIRGLKFKRPDGQTVRPSLVVLDDPQTDESARSPMQCATRESILAGAILGLAGPGQKISGIMPCTVIRPDDMADRILDLDKHPEWQGERMKMVYEFPTNEKLWNEYADIRAESLRIGNGGKEATELYLSNREAMDAGAVVAWQERYNLDEISALQHAMNLLQQDKTAFYSEYQNEPLPEDEILQGDLDPEKIAAKINGRQRGSVPLAATRLTAFIDIQQNILFYVVCAWEEDFTGYVIDYGAWPDQQRNRFWLTDLTKTLSSEIPGTGLEGSIYGGLDKLTQQIIGREWPREDGVHLRIERCLIDANWGSSTDVVYQFCRESKFAAIMMPSHGKYVGASGRSFSEYRKKQGDRLGFNWRIPAGSRREVRYALYDTNHWKTFVHQRLAIAQGDRGCLSIYGSNPDRHRLLAEHLVAEYPVRTEARGRIVDEWKLKATRPENHWLDCLVGAAVAASILGVSLPGTPQMKPETKRRTIKLSDLQRAKR